MDIDMLSGVSTVSTVLDSFGVVSMEKETQSSWQLWGILPMTLCVFEDLIAIIHNDFC